MATEITVKYKIENGRLISEKNINRIFAIGEAGKLDGLLNVTKVDVKTYVPRYKLVKEDEGYIFREVMFNLGIAGASKTLREQVIKASMWGYTVVVE